MFVGAEVGGLRGEEADAFVEAARHHRLLGQADDAPVREHARGGTQNARRLRLRGIGRCRGAGLRRFHFHVVRERDHALDPTGVKTLLAANSAIPGQPAGTVNAEWGFGLIDAANL